MDLLSALRSAYKSQPDQHQTILVIAQLIQADQALSDTQVEQAEAILRASDLWRVEYMAKLRPANQPSTFYPGKFSHSPADIEQVCMDLESCGSLGVVRFIVQTLRSGMAIGTQLEACAFQILERHDLVSDSAARVLGRVWTED